MSKFFFKISFALAGLIFLFVVSMYIVAASTGFEGRRGGYQDAFRHIYASALVSKYLSPKAVSIVTYIFEPDMRSSYDLMDRHNNKLGASLGFVEGDVYKAVYQRVKNSKSLSDAGETDAVILSKDMWSNGF